MATIVFANGKKPIIGSRRGLTFDISQAGNYVKSRPRPCNPSTNGRAKNNTIIKDANTYFWNLSQPNKNLWAAFAQASGITGPYGMRKNQQACAGFFACAVVAAYAGDGFPITPGNPLPITGVTILTLTRIDKDTVRVTFTPSPTALDERLYLRQSAPGPGVKRSSQADGYIAQISPANITSPHDFTTKFQHLSGWNGRYWVGTQNTTGGRSQETLFDL